MLSTYLNVAMAVGSVLADVVHAAPGGVADLWFAGQELHRVVHGRLCLQDAGNGGGEAPFPNKQENAAVGWYSPRAGAQQLTAVFPGIEKNDIQAGFV